MFNFDINLNSLSSEEREKFFMLMEKANKFEYEKKKPQEGESYYFIDDEGHKHKAFYNNLEADRLRYAIGNYFLTAEEADHAVEKLKITTELKRFAEEHNTEIDWNDIKQFKYFLYYNHIIHRICVSDNTALQRADTYFSSKELALKAIDAIGTDRLKKYYFDVI